MIREIDTITNAALDSHRKCVYSLSMNNAATESTTTNATVNALDAIVLVLPAKSTRWRQMN